MPTYDYHCPANGTVLEVSHKMSESVATWGELCRRTGHAPGRTPPNAKVVRLITGGSVVRSGALGSTMERPCDTGPCGAPVCGGGACGFDA